MDAPITNDEAVRRHPELQDLVTVREAGWCFRPIQGEVGELERIAGSYRRQLYTDAIFIFDRTLLGEEYRWRQQPASDSLHLLGARQHPRLHEPGRPQNRRQQDPPGPHGIGAYLIALNEAAANQLFDALGKWLG